MADLGSVGTSGSAETVVANPLTARLAGVGWGRRCGSVGTDVNVGERTRLLNSHRLASAGGGIGAGGGAPGPGVTHGYGGVG